MKEKIEQILEATYNNIELFSDIFLEGYKIKDGKKIKTPKFHKEIRKKIKQKNNDIHKLNIIVPRGHGKTTAMFFFMLHSILFQEYKKILYVAHSRLGEEVIGKIRKELETNKYIKGIFGNLVPTNLREQKEEFGTKKRRQKELQLTNGIEIETLSKGESIRGIRPDLIIVDDPQENKDVLNKRVVDKFDNWFFTSLYNTLLPGGTIVVLGTVVGSMCLVEYLRNEKKRKTIKYEAIMDGKSLRPAMRSLRKLEQRKKDIGTTLFNQEFMNIPLQRENAIISQEDLQFFDFRDIKEFEKIYWGIDPATSEKEMSDSFVITITGIKGDKKYVIHVEELKGKQKNIENIQRVVNNLREQYKPNIVWFEKTNQDILKRILQNLHHPLKSINPSKDKYERLLAYQGDFQQGKVFLNKNMKNLSDVIYQLTYFPDVEHDDIVDSLVYSFGKNVGKVIFYEI